MKFFKNIFKKFEHLWKTKRWWVIAGAVVLLIVIRQATASGQQEQLTFASPVRETLVKTLDVSGVVDAKEKAALRFLAGGKVVYLGAKEGDSIKKWQTIATIDAASLAKSQEKSLNLYSKERLDWEQQQDDIEDRTIDQAEQRTVAKDQLDLTNSVIDVQLAAIAVSNTIMSSPIAGVLVSSPTNVTGVVLGPTDTFTVVNPSTLVFRALVDEADIALVTANQTATIELDAYPDEYINSAVSYIAYQSNLTASGTVFAVEFPIQSVDGLAKYRLGMNGDVSITLDVKENVLTIPLIATRERDGKTFVDVKTGEKTFEEREIVTGLETDEKVEVVSGLSENDQVVLPE
jgi:RND family efflux transporter MFP subunit